VMGNILLAGALANGSKPTTTGGSSAITFVILAVLVVLFYMLVMRPQRNRQRRTVQTQNQVVPGQRIRTTAGMYGTVVSGDDRDVVVEIAPGVEVTMLRRAIMDVVPDDDGMSQPQDMTDDEDGSEDSATHDDWDGNEDHSSDDWDIKDRNI
jgi:preprotein translocase subunit YajC